MENMELYNKLRTPAEGAVKPIQGGNLKGKSDINPQWKIEALTQALGPCGIGWKFEVAEEKTVDCANGEVMLFVKVALRYRNGDDWSAPIYGYGGDKLVEKNKNGLVPNDEAYKMCVTDALGNAMKYLGVAADVYRGLFDSKYNRQTAQDGSQHAKNYEQKGVAGQTQNNQPRANQQPTGDKYVQIWPDGSVAVAVNAGKDKSGRPLAEYRNIRDVPVADLEKMAGMQQYKLAHKAIQDVLAETAA